LSVNAEHFLTKAVKMTFGTIFLHLKNVRQTLIKI